MPSNPTDALIADLQEEIAKGRVLAIVGAGVSVGATDRHPHASWIGLLESGVDRCLSVAQPLPAGWEDRVRGDIHSGDMIDLLSAAEKISSKLGSPSGGEYRRWLRETVGSLPLKDRSVLEALRDLGVPIATTNYDDLFEEVTDLDPVTWQDGAQVERVLRKDDQAILHLHGFWKKPESVILGIRSYEEILGNAHAQNILHVLRTVSTLLFIGYGEGLADPNFGPFLQWTRKVFAGSEYRHYRLCRDSEVDKLRQLHPPEERIFILPYGPNHSDLAPFLRRLKVAKAVGRTVRVSAPASAMPASNARLLPPPPRIFGRDDEIRSLVDAILATPLQPVPVLGPPGMGKSTLTQAALYDRRVIERFGNRRYFVRCEGATTRDALASEIALALGVEPGPNTEARLFQELERAPALLVLDNTEIPWERDTTAVEELLSLLGTIEGAPLVTSIRGEQRPLGPNWREAIRVGPLSLEAARDAFLAIAGERYRADPDLDPLLEAVDRLPLAITLLAHQAEGEPDLAGLWRRWCDERTAMLQRAGGRERLTNLELSLELSIQGPRMTEPAKRLLSLLGLLPDGMAREDLLQLLPEEGEEAASVLRKVGLAIPHDVRLRVLAPVREHVQRRHPSQLEDLERILDHYLSLAKLGRRVGGEGGAEATQRLASEIGNLEAMTLRALERSDPVSGIQAAQDLGTLFKFTGFGSTNTLEIARQSAAAVEKTELAAACTLLLGNILLDKYNHEAAYTYYEQAIPLFKSVNNMRGEALCIHGLGDCAFRRSEYSTAQAYYEQAITLFQSIHHLAGEATSIFRLGLIANARSDAEAARTYLEQAIPLFQSIHDLSGEANCIGVLGEIALAQCDHDTARAAYERALPLFQRIGNLLGEANCIYRLGDIALEQEEPETAQNLFNKALGLYERFQDPYSVGWAHIRLARITLILENRNHHVEAAREAWTRIKRPDLVGILDQEFGPAVI